MSKKKVFARRFATILTILITMVLLGYQAASVYAEETDLHYITSEAEGVPETSCSTVLLYDVNSGQIIYEKEGDVQRTPASITKVMTCILVLENLNPDEVVTIPDGISDGLYGNLMDLLPGEELTVEQLTKTMMVYSANDAAVALAIAVAGSEEAFVEMMNEKAEEIGATHTNFLNPNGLTESYSHTTTAEDLMLITRYALDKQEFRDIVKLKSYTVPATNLSDERKFKSTNKLLYDESEKFEINGEMRYLKYDGTFGIKTGIMGSSGYCFAGGAERDGEQYVAICLLGSDDNSRFIDAVALLDYAFENYDSKELIAKGGKAGKVKVKYGSKTKVETEVSDGLYATVNAGDEGADVEYKIELYDDVQAPIKKGTKVGEAKAYDGDELISVSDITISESVDEGGPWSAWYISDVTAYIIIAAMLVAIALLILIARNAKRKKKRRDAARGRRRRR